MHIQTSLQTLEAISISICIVQKPFDHSDHSRNGYTRQPNLFKLMVEDFFLENWYHLFCFYRTNGSMPKHHYFFIFLQIEKNEV